MVDKYELWGLKISKIDWVRNKIGLGKTVLDVGCADCEVWKGVPFNITTIDKRVSHTGEICIPDIVAEAEHLPMGDNSFDIVVETELLEHVENPNQVLKEAVRVAKEKVIITVPWEQMWTEEYKPFTHPEHIRFYTPALLDEELRRIGMPFQIQILAFGFILISAEIYCCGKKE